MAVLTTASVLREAIPAREQTQPHPALVVAPPVQVARQAMVPQVPTGARMALVVAVALALAHSPEQALAVSLVAAAVAATTPLEATEASASSTRPQPLYKLK